MKKVDRFAIFLVLCSQSSCTYRDINKTIDCDQSGLTVSLSSKTNPTTCLSMDGQIILSASAGTPPYSFSLGGDIFQTDPAFNGLTSGTYEGTVKDVNGCQNSVQVDISAPNSTLAMTSSSTLDSECLTGNGSITVTPTGGVSPYTIKIDNGAFGTATTFSDLATGNHNVTVKDASGCQRVVSVAVARGNTGVSYLSDIAPIFTVSCNFNGCHGTGSSGRDWTKFTDVMANASDIKIRTGNRSMPTGNVGPSLTDREIQLIACWVDDGANNN